LVRSSEAWSSFRETQLGTSGAAAIRLADVLSQDASFSDADNGAALFPNRGDELFATGHYRATRIRPFLQYFDFDLQMTSDTRIRGCYPPSLCINLILGGRWTTVVDGRPVEMTCAGIPSVLAAGHEFESVMTTRIGQRIRGASLYIGKDFFQANAGGDEGLIQVFSLLCRSGVRHHEFRSCDVLRSILHRLHANPYHGAMSRLHAESLALSAIVELGAHVDGACRGRMQSRTRRHLAHEARSILDQEMKSPPSVSVLARRIGTSEITLRRLFKATFGLTLVDYVRQCRLDAARHLLREGHLRISEIAYRVGYTEPANFTAAYRGHFGYPPSRELVTRTDRCAQGIDRNS
jgi:AraC-like DNA-binding protein